jgi:hypothetical protein
VNSLLVGIAAAAAAALVTGLLTYFVTAWKVRRDLHIEYDRSLRSDRLRAYAHLWSWTQSFSRYQPAPMTGAAAAQLLARLTHWYYQLGGMYLSAATREKYFTLMKSLQRITENTVLNEEIDKTQFRSLQNQASDLRTQITNDVGTRKPPLYSQPDSR